jgi:hypothetical protein
LFRRRAILYATILGTLLLWMAIEALVPNRAGFLPYLIAATVIPMVVAGFWTSSYRCPRCGNRFQIKESPWFPRLKDPFTRHCLNCGLGQREHA